MKKTDPHSLNVNLIIPSSILLVFSFALWLLSLVFPALISPYDKHSLSGLEILSIGWLGVVGVEDVASLVGVLAWWANPFYLWAISNLAFGKYLPIKTTYFALTLASLTLLLSSYAINEAPVFTPVIAYGPGALFWLLAVLSLAYIVSSKAGHQSLSKMVIIIIIILLLAYFFQVGWRAFASNDTEKVKLPYYSAKRGVVCSVKMIPLPIIEKQSVIKLNLSEYNKDWLNFLLDWGIKSVQFDGIEYMRAPQGSPESMRYPYMIGKIITLPARYTFIAQGGSPIVNETSDSSDVYLSIVDNLEKKEIGQLAFHREMNSRLGFCPSLEYYSTTKTEEVIKWLSPFISPQVQK